MDKPTVNCHNLQFGIDEGHVVMYSPSGNEVSRHPIQEIGFSEGLNQVDNNIQVHEFTMIYPDGNTIMFQDEDNLAEFAESFRQEKAQHDPGFQ